MFNQPKKYPCLYFFLSLYYLSFEKCINIVGEISFWSVMRAKSAKRTQGILQ